MINLVKNNKKLVKVNEYAHACSCELICTMPIEWIIDCDLKAMKLVRSLGACDFVGLFYLSINK